MVIKIKSHNHTIVIWIEYEFWILESNLISLIILDKRYKIYVYFFWNNYSLYNY